MGAAAWPITRGNKKGGNRMNAMAALLRSAKLTKEQLQELEEILGKCKDKDKDKV